MSATPNYATDLGQPRPETPPETKVGSLDMARADDRKMAVAAVLGERGVKMAGDGDTRRRWSTDQELRDQVVQALRVALRWALERKDARNVKGCAAELGRLERQNQEDEHLAIKQDAPDTNVQVNVVLTIPAPKVRGES